MFPIYKKLELLKLISNMNLEAVNMVDRVKVLSAGLATHLSRRAPLPTTPVVSVREYFENNVREQLRQAICGFNETYVICTDLVEELAYKLFLLRYEAVYCTMELPLTGCENFDDRFFNLKFFLSEEDQKFLNTNAVYIALVSRRLSDLSPMNLETLGQSSPVRTKGSDQAVVVSAA